MWKNRTSRRRNLNEEEMFNVQFARKEEIMLNSIPSAQVTETTKA